MSFNIADLFEHVVDAVPDRIALVDRDLRQSFAELETRANRIAHALAERGVGVGDHVGIYAQNSHEWVETMYGAFKTRAIPININYRYVTDELAYLLGNADCVACVFDRQYADRLEAVREHTPTLKSLIWIDDGTDGPTGEAESYDEVCAAASPERDFGERSGDDLYVLYTGGTTGMPKGVMWRQEDVYFALGQGIDALTGERVADEWTMSQKAAASGGGLSFLVIPPLMHGAAQWGSMGQMLQGNTIVLLPKFSGDDVWSVVEKEGVNSALITGDAMGRPMIDHLLEDPTRYDTSSIIAVASSAAIFSPTVKDQFLEVFPNLIITDSIGSSEGGFNGIKMVGKGTTQQQGGPTVIPGPDVAVLNDDLELIDPSSNEVGKLGRTGNIPIGYYKDEKKTAETFIIAADGRRYAMGGDMACWEPDGTLTLLGRGSTTINSGGEKIHPEEVEQALKDHPAVFDCIVVGVPDERWGQAVAVVVQFREGHDAELTELTDHARKFVAGYKVPREMHRVDEIVRSPSGKPDYPWAAKLARGDR